MSVTININTLKPQYYREYLIAAFKKSLSSLEVLMWSI